MLVVALVLAVVGLAALVTAVVTSNELVAWVCIAASVLGVILLIIDAIRERQSRDEVSVDDEAEARAVAPAAHTVDETYENFDAEYPDEAGSVDAVDEPVRELDADEQVSDIATDERVTASEVSGVASGSERLPEVQYVPSEASDSTMEVRYETSDEPEAVLEDETDKADETGPR